MTRHWWWSCIGRVMTVPLHSCPGTRTAPVGVPQQMRVTLVEVSVNVSVTVSSKIVGVQETAELTETVVEGDSWVIVGLVGGGISVNTCNSNILHEMSQTRDAERN